MPFATAATRGLKRLYHWQTFDASRLEVILRNGTIYCSRPSDFNDPWDCQPFFNTDLLDDPIERQKHIDWAAEVCRRNGKMSERDIVNMEEQLQNRGLLEQKVSETTTAMQQEVLERYRVYCMCPDVTNTLMWAHYADKHRGICLEFNIQNEVVCCALEVQYSSEFPMTRQYSDDLAENLLPLLAKSDVWKYENEYRLIAQEAANATAHDTLITNNGQLRLPEGALSAIIVGCQAQYDAVQDVVHRCNTRVPLLRARKTANRYKLSITL